LRRLKNGVCGAGLLIVLGAAPCALGQAVAQNAPAASAEQSLGPLRAPLAVNVWQWKGLRVETIQFEGVTFDAEDTLPKGLEQQAGVPLDPEKVRASLRRLYASGRYRDVSVRGIRTGDTVSLIFEGPPRLYVGRVQVLGIKNDRLTSLAEYGTKLTPGTAFTEASVPAGAEGIKQSLASNGYMAAMVTVRATEDVANQQMNVTYIVTIGPQAKVGNVVVEGNDVGLTTEEFRKKGKLKQGAKVTRDTTSNALAKLRTQYQKRDRLEATVSLQKSTYDDARKALDYDFKASQGPIVKVVVEGAKISRSRLHLLVPVFEESTVDNDLLNEGTHNIKEFLQQQGFFDSTVTVKVIGEDTPQEMIIYSVDKGRAHKVIDVTIAGNKYFSTDVLKERLQVQRADAYQRSGRYSRRW